MSRIAATIVILTAFIIGIMIAGVSDGIRNNKEQNSKDSTNVKI